MKYTVFIFPDGDVETIEGILTTDEAGLKDTKDIGYIRQLWVAEYKGESIGPFQTAIEAEQAIIEKSEEQTDI